MVPFYRSSALSLFCLTSFFAATSEFPSWKLAGYYWGYYSWTKPGHKPWRRIPLSRGYRRTRWSSPRRAWKEIAWSSRIEARRKDKRAGSCFRMRQSKASWERKRGLLVERHCETHFWACSKHLSVRSEHTQVFENEMLIKVPYILSNWRSLQKRTYCLFFYIFACWFTQCGIDLGNLM